MPAYSLLLSLSTSGQSNIDSNGADPCPAQDTSAAPSVSLGSSGTEPEDTRAAGIRGFEAGGTAVTVAGAAPHAGTQSTACFVAELMVKALQGGCDPAGCDTDDHRVGLESPYTV